MTLLQQVRFTKEAQRIVQFPSMLNVFGTTETSAYFVIPLLEKTRFSGMLVLAYSLEDIRLELLKSLRGVLVYVLLYGSVLVLIGYYLLQRNIITPARHLLLATENVRARKSGYETAVNRTFGNFRACGSFQPNG